MTASDWIQIAIAIITLLGIITSLVISICTLKQNSKVIEDSNKANIILYIDFNPTTSRYYIIIKNFGHSVGKLISIKITPKLNWKKTKFNQDMKPITDSKNVLLSPNQKIASWFDFKDYPDRKFKVTLKYESLEKLYTNEYEIDLSFVDNIDWLIQYSFDDNTQDNKEALYKINNSIQDLTDKFR